MAAIRRIVQEIVRRFQPEKVILFGSYACGRATPDSDVDLLVVMPAANEINQAVRILLAVPHPFSLDLIVRTPETLQRRLALGDSFLQEVVDTGRVLYEKADRRMGSQSRSRPQGRAKLRGRRPPLNDPASFHCQQAAEKYLKALLHENGLAVPKTHDLEKLLGDLLPHDATLGVSGCLGIHG